jgi:hypothetical protein
MSDRRGGGGKGGGGKGVRKDDLKSVLKAGVRYKEEKKSRVGKGNCTTNVNAEWFLQHFQQEAGRLSTEVYFNVLSLMMASSDFFITENEFKDVRWCGWNADAKIAILVSFSTFYHQAQIRWKIEFPQGAQALYGPSDERILQTTLKSIADIFSLIGDKLGVKFLFGKKSAKVVQYLERFQHVTGKKLDVDVYEKKSSVHGVLHGPCV